MPDQKSAERPAFRKTTQRLAPAYHESPPPGQYNLYPGFPIGTGKIEIGYRALARKLAGQRHVMIDGYVGVLWEDFRARLHHALLDLGLWAAWYRAEDGLRSEAEIERLVAPFLGGGDPLFGKRFAARLENLFAKEYFQSLAPDPSANLTIVYGCGAALAGWEAILLYVDLPKNEIQFRARAGTVHNLGVSHPGDARSTYKRFYFVDWVVLNRHKAELLPRVDIVVDEQRPHEPSLMAGDDLRAALEEMGRSYFRVRPWFEPGPWGGQWIKEKIRQLSRTAPNYAWSFELIVPENGLMLESDGRLLEVSFDWLMYHDNHAVLGGFADRFGTDFPIRFDFLDTWDGGNLSLQCHPRPDYIRDHFGEAFTQDETYYILDCKPDATVYLGFRGGIDPGAFGAELERSVHEGTIVEVERFVNRLPARKHDLFLIPHGTVHCAGEGNLVLEISATPYIFTFKMYDWLRQDLDGKPRPLNIERAFENLYFEYQGERIQREFISQPSVLDSGEGWRRLHLATHPTHFYDVHRFEFIKTVTARTGGSPHVMNLVEGESIILETANGHRRRFNYAETFVVPAAAGHYRLINEGTEPVKVIDAFLKS